MKAIKTILTLSIFLGSFYQVDAQTQPVSANIQVMPPYTAVYADYLSLINNKIRGSVILNDLNEPSLDIRLHLRIEGPNLIMETKPNFVGPLLTLTPGAPLVLDITHIGPYLDINAVDFLRGSRQEFANSGKFPEDLYTFSLTVKEYNTGKAISNPAMAMVWMRLNDEPTIISPQLEEVIPINGPQNIFFQWQLNSPVNVGVPFTPMYKFYLYEVMQQEQDPLYALTNGTSILVYESPELFTTSLQYTLNMPTLDVGKRYMYRVQAIDPTGNNVFRNDGFSPPSWFYYGYPEGGVITNEKFTDEYKVRENDPKIFEWSAPDNLVDNQTYTYKLKIVQIDDKDAAPAPEDFQYLPAWFEDTTSPTTSTEGYAYDLRQPLDKQKWYAWYVTAHTGQQTIAASEVWTFQGPALVGFLRAGKHTVYVSELKNEDLDNLSGVGSVKVFQTDTDSTLTEIEFEGIQVAKVAGRFVLRSGEIRHAVESGLEFEVPGRDERNGNATFHPSEIKLTKDELSVYGHTEWTFSHPVKGQNNVVKTLPNWLNFDDYAPFGTNKLPEGVEFELLDPFGFKIQLASTSEIQMFNTDYKLIFDGNVVFSDKVKNIKGNELTVPFERIEQLFYVTVADEPLPVDARVLDGIGIGLNSNEYILDLSENESPRKVNEKDWKGFYFKNLVVDIPEDFDQSNQLKLNRDFELDYQQNASGKVNAWIDGTGLTFIWDHDFKGDQVAKFNTFPMKLGDAKIDIQGNALSDSEFLGTMNIPMLNPTREYEMALPLMDKGFGAGYFNDELEDQFTFSEYGGENKAVFTIKQAAFKDNERLQLAVDIDIPALGFPKPVSINDFRIYGDYFIGFGKRNGLVQVNNQEGSYNGYAFELNQIAASLQAGEYVFSYRGTMKTEPEFSNPDGGEPIVSFHSTAKTSSAVATATENARYETDVPKPTLTGDYSPTQIQMTFGFSFKNAFLDIKSELYRVKDDPEWGTRFKGEIHGKLLQPAKIEMGGLVTFGSIDNQEYFYIDGYAADKNGQGVTVYPNINMVGFEGRLYHKMDVSSDFELEINKDVNFGAALYGQFIDLGKLGQFFMADVGMEMKSTSSDLDLKISGDISLFNKSGRSPTLLANAVDSLKKEVIKEGIKQALKAIGPIEEEVPLGGGVTSKFYLDERSASIALDKSGYEAKVYGQLDGGGAFGGITLSKDDIELNVEGDLNERVTGRFKGSGIGAALTYDPSKQGGDFKLDYSDFSLAGSASKNSQTGKLDFSYGSNTRALLDGNLANKSGELILNHGDLQIETDASLEDLKGEFDLTYKGDAFNSSVDGIAQKGDMFFSIDGNEVGVGFNALDKNGTVSFANADISTSVYAAQAGQIDIKTDFGGDHVYLNGDINVGGKIDFKIEGQEANGWMNLEGRGGVEFRNDEVYVKAEGDQVTKAGAIAFEREDIRIEAAGDPTKQEAMVDVRFDGNKVAGDFTLEEQSLEVIVEEEDLTMNALHNADTTGLSMTRGEELFAVGGDPQNKNGFVHFKSGTDEIFVKADQPAKTGQLRFNYDNITASADVKPEIKTASFSMDDLAMAGMISDDSASISLNESTNEYSIAVSQAGNNKLRVKREEIDLTVKANQNTKSGSFDMEIPDYVVNSAIDPSSVELGFEDKSEGIILNASANKDEQKAAFDLDLEDELTIMAEGNVSNQSGKFAFANEDVEVDAEAFVLAKKGSVHFKNADVDVTVKGDKLAQSGLLDLTVQETEKVFASFDRASGKGALNVEIEDTKTELQADLTGILKINSVIGENTVLVDVNKETGGEMDINIEGNEVAAWMYLSGRGGLEFEREDLYIKVEGNKEEQSGALAFKNLDIDLSALANAGNKSGEIDFAYLTNKVHGKFSQELQEVSLEAEGVKLLGFHNADSTFLSVEESDKYFAVGGDPANKRGFLDVRQANDKIYASVDQPKGFGEVDIRYSGMELAGLMSAERKSASFKSDQINMSGLLLGTDSLGAELAFDQNQFIIGLNKSSLINSVFAKTSDFEASVFANPNAKAGSLALVIPDHDVKASIANEKGQFSYIGAIDLSAEIESAGNGKLNFKKDDLSAYLDGGKTRELNSLGFKKGSDQIDVAMNKAGNVGQATLNFSGKRAKAVFSPETQYAVIGEGADSLRVTHLGEGVGMLDMGLQNMTLNLKADPNKGIGNLAFDGAGNKLVFNALVNDRQGDFAYEGNGVVSRGKLAGETNSLYASYNQNYLRVNQDGDNYGGGVRYEADSVGFDFLPDNRSARVDLAFQNNTIDGDVDWKNFGANLAVNLQEFDCNFDMEVNPTTFKYAIADGCDLSMDLDFDFDANLPKIDLEVPGLAFNLGTLPDIPYKLDLGDIDLSLDADFGFDVALPNFQVDMPSLDGLQGFSLGQLPAFKINGVDFTTDMPNVDFSGFDVDLGIGTIDFSGLAGIPLTMELSAANLKLNLNTDLTLDFTLNNGWTIALPGAYDLEIGLDYDANWSAIKFQLPNFVGFDISPENIKLLNAGDLMFDISPDLLKFNLDGYAIDVSPEAMNFNMPDFEAGLKLNGFDISMGDLSAGLDLDTGLDFQMGDMLSVELGTDFAGLEYDGYKLNLTNNFGTFGMDIDGKLLSFDATQLSIDLEDYSLALNPEKIGFEFDQDFLNLGFDGNIEATFGDIGLNVKPDIGVDFETPDFTAGLKTDGLFARVSDINFDLSFDPKLTASGFGDHIVALTPNSFDYQFGDISLGHVIDERISFKGLDVNLDLDKFKGVEAFYQEYDLGLTLEGGLNVFISDQNFMKITPETFDVQFEGIDVAFGDNPLLSFKSPYGDFDLTPESLAIGALDYNLAFDTDLNFKLGGPDLDFNISPVTFGLTFGDYGMGLDTDYVLDFKSPEYSFRTDDLNFEMGDWTLGLKLDLQGDFEANILKDIDTSFKLNSLGLGEVNFEGVKLGFGGEKFFDFAYQDINLFGGFERFDFNYTDYTISLGLDTLFAFNMPDLSISYSDPQLGFNYGDYKFGFSPELMFGTIGDIQVDIGLKDYTFGLSGLADHEIDLSFDGVDYKWGTNLDLSFGVGEFIRFEGYDMNFELDPLKGFDLGYQDYLISLTPELDLGLQLGAVDKLINLNPELLDVTWEDINLGFGLNKNLWFNMEPYGFEITTRSLALDYEDLSLGIGLDKTLQFFKGPDISLQLNPKLIDFKMPDYALGFDTRILSLETPYIAFSTADLMFDIGDYRMGLTLIDDIPAIQLTGYDLDVNVNMDLLGRFNYDRFDIDVSPDLLFDFTYDNNLNLYGSWEYLKFHYDDIDIKVGLDTLFYFNYDDWDLYMRGLSGPGLFVSYLKDYELGLTLEGLQFSHFNAGDLQRRVLGTLDYELKYWEYDFDEFMLSLGIPENYAYSIGFQKDDYTLNFGRIRTNVNEFLKIGDYTAGLEIDGVGDLDISFNKSGKFGGRVELPDGKWGWGALKAGGGFAMDGNILPFSLGGTPEPEPLEGEMEINTDGPKYIGKITDDADGFAKGSVDIQWNKSMFYVTGAVGAQVGSLACFDGAMAFKVKGADDWFLKIGKKEQPVTFKPFCNSSALEGWMYIDPTRAELAYEAGFDWRAGFDFDVVKAEAYCSYHFGAAFGINYDEFQILDASIFSRMKAGVDAEFCAGSLCTKSITLASIYYSGLLQADFANLRARGQVEGELTVWGISSGNLSLGVEVGID